MTSSSDEQQNRSPDVDPSARAAEQPPADLAILFEPIRLGTVEIRNRVVMTGHGTGMAQNHLPSDAHTAYYRERAVGGVGPIGMAFPQIHGKRVNLDQFDTVVLAGWHRPVADLHFEMKDRGVAVERIGDAIASRTMMEAVHEGERAARRL